MAVARWNGRLVPLGEEVAPVEPRPELWARIEASISKAAQPEGPARGDNVVQLRRRLGLSRLWAGGATAIAASLAFVLFTRPEAAPPPPAPAPAAAPAPLVAMLASEKGAARLLATYDPAAGALLIAPAGLEPVRGQAHQLWLIPADGKPLPLTLVAAGKPARMKMPEEMRGKIGARATLAISVEPPGGSPTGLPTGAVIASGTLTET
ncbi:MAG TPA: anti-sigma factor [Geminicoccaceae bacterium]